MAKKSILMIEDDAEAEVILGRRLEKEGYEVYYATYHDDISVIVSEGHFDVVVLDIYIPRSVGYSILEDLQNSFGGPVVVISNFGQDEEIAEGIRLGARSYLVKSNNSLEHIVDEVKEVL